MPGDSACENSRGGPPATDRPIAEHLTKNGTPEVRQDSSRRTAHDARYYEDLDDAFVARAHRRAADPVVRRYRRLVREAA